MEDPPPRNAEPMSSRTLWTAIAVLVLLWLVATVVKFTAGGLIHLLLLVAVGLLVYKFVVKKERA